MHAHNPTISITSFALDLMFLQMSSANRSNNDKSRSPPKMMNYEVSQLIIQIITPDMQRQKIVRIVSGIEHETTKYWTPNNRMIETRRNC